MAEFFCRRERDLKLSRLDLDQETYDLIKFVSPRIILRLARRIDGTELREMIFRMICRKNNFRVKNESENEYERLWREEYELRAKRITSEIVSGLEQNNYIRFDMETENFKLLWGILHYFVNLSNDPFFMKELEEQNSVLSRAAYSLFNKKTSPLLELHRKLNEYRCGYYDQECAAWYETSDFNEFDERITLVLEELFSPAQKELVFWLVKSKFLRKNISEPEKSLLLSAFINFVINEGIVEHRLNIPFYLMNSGR